MFLRVCERLSQQHLPGSPPLPPSLPTRPWTIDPPYTDPVPPRKPSASAGRCGGRGGGSAGLPRTEKKYYGESSLRAPEPRPRPPLCHGERCVMQ
ncbi:hypothetical protein E2C01_001084 [Portunus trituberculatus]|uniref:Uncharacterized protein n=1 Tax=Portunus trituberculatus TaxID=210409 RepID=A0A5B7CGB1_PORTR|nr:hypothetical protein [Portunus trituberculatus]